MDGTALTFTKKKNIIIMERSKTSTLQLNLMQWGNNIPKYDLRIWKNDKPGKGVTLDQADLRAFLTLLDNNIQFYDEYTSKIPQNIGTADFPCQLFQKCGFIGSLEQWHIELNVLGWKNNPCKFDLRNWSKDHKSGKGVSFSKEDAEKLAETIKKELAVNTTTVEPKNTQEIEVLVDLLTGK